ncbi:carotenoid biosynthesis protein [Nocardia sp. BMG111209]|uniref:carotenoid biosynthesis protein n=1 Tax=Nocardia sp. BMG111209 TaxID=1160137 RepID=UPI00037D403B|nr:carotenoid biosynthesis protein [Nocardia sp. BMG111209]
MNERVAVSTAPGASPRDTPRGPIAVACGAAGLWLIATAITVPVTRSAVASTAEAVAGLALAVLAATTAWLHYGGRGLATFTVIAAVVSFAAESCSIATGFPFGHYVHHQPGPKLLGVPPSVVVGWVVLAWLAWLLARTVTGADTASEPTRRYLVPLVAAFIVGGYDFVLDPVAGTVRNLYSYDSPSGLFGVPLSNFFGWLLTSWLIFQIFALVRRGPATPTRIPRYLVAIVWLISAAVPYLARTYPHDPTVTRGNRTFVTADIYDGSLAAGLFVMVPIALLALIRLAGERQ